MKTSLSKSRYTKYCQCAKALWLSVNKPDEATVDAGVEARFAEGNVVGDLAMGLFGDFVEVTTMTEDGKLDLSAMIDKTREEMARGTEVICEASFSYDRWSLWEKSGMVRPPFDEDGNFDESAHGDGPMARVDAGSNYCAVDILRKTADGWAIYEVKSTTSHVADVATMSKELVDKVEKYAKDIAFQKWVLVQCGVKVTGTYLVTLNSDYVRQGDLDVQQLFNIIDMKELVENEYLKVPAQQRMAHTVLQGDEPQKGIGMHCSDPYQCAFWNYCTRQVGLDLENDKTTVFDLYRMSAKKKFELFDQGKVTFEDVRHDKLNAKQQVQVECTLNGTEHINKQGILEFLNKVTYPLYFLDFETMQQVLPQFDGTRPYQQITFQYSLHYIEHEGGELKHTAFLTPSNGTDPRRALAEALCNDIAMNSCIMAYNDPFEKGRIKEMAEAYPDLDAHLMNLHGNIIDLLIPFRDGHCYRPAMGGSFSIKSVLPALFPDDEELNYHNLNPLVQNGGHAMTIFPKIKDMPPKEAEEARQALLAYCHLDTLAMVRVWERLLEMVT